MTRNLKKQGWALLAVLVLGAAVASSASAATEHDFHSDGSWTVATGKNVGTMKLAVGAAGTIECTEGEFEDQSFGSEVSAGTYKTDTLTVSGRFEGCTFGGQPATVNMNHCAFLVDSDTTSGNSDGGEHANVDIECQEGSKIEVDASPCTLTIAAQTVNHAIRFENDTASSLKGFWTAKKIVVGKVKTTESQTGCALIPTGAIGTLSGNGTMECFKDGGSPLASTEKTTPHNLTTESGTTECKVSNL